MKSRVRQKLVWSGLLVVKGKTDADQEHKKKMCFWLASISPLATNSVCSHANRNLDKNIQLTIDLRVIYE